LAFALTATIRHGERDDIGESPVELTASFDVP
jgi:hypothetical protein